MSIMCFRLFFFLFRTSDFDSTTSVRRSISFAIRSPGFTCLPCVRNRFENYGVYGAFVEWYSRKPKYWARNMSHCYNEINLNIARMFNTFRTVSTHSVSIAQTNHLTLFREMVVACCENHSKLNVKVVGRYSYRSALGVECSIEVKLPIWMHWFTN
jgi:hypothetical protein